MAMAWSVCPVHMHVKHSAIVTRQRVTVKPIDDGNPSHNAVFYVLQNGMRDLNPKEWIPDMPMKFELLCIMTRPGV